MILQWPLILYDIIMGNDFAKDVHCEITMGNDIAQDIYCDVTMCNDVAMCTYHGISMHNDVAKNLFYYVFSAYYVILLWIVWNKCVLPRLIKHSLVLGHEHGYNGL